MKAIALLLIVIIALPSALASGPVEEALRAMRQPTGGFAPLPDPVMNPPSLASTAASLTILAALGIRTDSSLDSTLAPFWTNQSYGDGSAADTLRVALIRSILDPTDRQHEQSLLAQLDRLANANGSYNFTTQSPATKPYLLAGTRDAVAAIILLGGRPSKDTGAWIESQIDNNVTDVPELQAIFSSLDAASIEGPMLNASGLVATAIERFLASDMRDDVRWIQWAAWLARRFNVSTDAWNQHLSITCSRLQAGPVAFMPGADPDVEATSLLIDACGGFQNGGVDAISDRVWLYRYPNGSFAQWTRLPASGYATTHALVVQASLQGLTPEVMGEIEEFIGTLTEIGQARVAHIAPLIALVGQEDSENPLSETVKRRGEEALIRYLAIPASPQQAGEIYDAARIVTALREGDSLRGEMRTYIEAVASTIDTGNREALIRYGPRLEGAAALVGAVLPEALRGAISDAYMTNSDSDLNLCDRTLHAVFAQGPPRELWISRYAHPTQLFKEYPEDQFPTWRATACAMEVANPGVVRDDAGLAPFGLAASTVVFSLLVALRQRRRL